MQVEQYDDGRLVPTMLGLGVIRCPETKLELTIRVEPRREVKSTTSKRASQDGGHCFTKVVVTDRAGRYDDRLTAPCFFFLLVGCNGYGEVR